MAARKPSPEDEKQCAMAKLLAERSGEWYTLSDDLFGDPQDSTIHTALIVELTDDAIIDVRGKYYTSTKAIHAELRAILKKHEDMQFARRQAAAGTP